LITKKEQTHGLKEADEWEKGTGEDKRQKQPSKGGKGGDEKRGG